MPLWRSNAVRSGNRWLSCAAAVSSSSHTPGSSCFPIGVLVVKSWQDHLEVELEEPPASAFVLFCSVDSNLFR